MTFLPVIDRELRVAARRRSTYWMRLAAALTALVIAGCFLLVSGSFGNSSTQLGGSLFQVLSWMCFVVVALSGIFLTADCLSEEKREGTLGLLFLTDLRGYDVVLGKLTATSLRAVYGVVAVFPIFGIAMLMGGVTGVQFWKSVLALVNTLFFSLATGVLISSISRDAQKAMNGTLLISLLFIVALPITDAIMSHAYSHPFKARLSMASPALAFTHASRNGSVDFWIATTIVHLLGWLFLALASLYAPRAWQEDGVRGGAPRQALQRPSSQRRATWRQRLLDQNPILWIVCRTRWQGILLRVLLGLLIAGLTLGFIGADNPQSVVYSGHFICAGLMLGFYLWIASQAVRFFIEASRSGALELLLASPLSGKEIVRGQWRGLLRIFLLPVSTLLLVRLFLGLGQISFLPNSGLVGFTPMLEVSKLGQVLALLAQIPASLLTLAAVGWTGMWFGLTTKKANWAVLKTLLLVIVIPSLAFSFTQGYLTILTFSIQLPRWVSVVVFITLSATKDLWFIRWSRGKLDSDFREIAASSFTPPPFGKPPPLPSAAIPPSIVPSQPA